MKFIRNLLVSVGFIGYFPFASGTVASFFAAILYYFCFGFLSRAEIINLYPNLIVIAGIIIVSLIFIPIIKSAEKELGHDSHKIVIDEVLGYFVAVLFLPHSLMVAIYAFIFFRIFDIAKPPFINELQSLPHGWGVICDDLLAGIYANICLQILLIVFPQFF
ncbi:MAG: phosphatidylglycerophosphatase A [Candidatus Cloacimonadota bacterium]|nr:phosphatidylglycerophosphatase A [Candidatus Cloacimonadota bacterium]